MIWVVCCDSASCKIYEYKKQDHFDMIHSIDQAEGKLRTSDLASDRPGKFKKKSTKVSMLAQPSDPKEIIIMEHLKDIASLINNSRTNNKFENLVIVASPKTSGHLIQELDKNTSDKITHNIQKDLMHLSEKELFEVIKKETKYPGL